jgi:hypothetical protein
MHDEDVGHYGHGHVNEPLNPKVPHANVGQW